MKNKLQSYSNNIISVIEKIGIYYIIITILSKLRVNKNWLYHILKWIITIPLTFMMSFAIGLLISFIVVVLSLLVQLFVDVGGTPIFLLYMIDFSTIGEFYLKNFFITIPLTILFHLNINAATGVLGYQLYAKNDKQINNVLKLNVFRELVCFIIFFLFLILYWTFIR